MYGQVRRHSRCPKSLGKSVVLDTFDLKMAKIDCFQRITLLSVRNIIYPTKLNTVPSHYLIATRYHVYSDIAHNVITICL